LSWSEMGNGRDLASPAKESVKLRSTKKELKYSLRSFKA